MGQGDVFSKRLMACGCTTLSRETILNIVSARHYDLQETLARCLFDALRALDDVQSVRIRTAKPDAYDDCETIAYQLSNL
jgi:dihydroneopterin aldolase